MKCKESKILVCSSLSMTYLIFLSNQKRLNGLTLSLICSTIASVNLWRKDYEADSLRLKIDRICSRIVILQHCLLAKSEYRKKTVYDLTKVILLYSLSNLLFINKNKNWEYVHVLFHIQTILGSVNVIKYL